MPTRTAVILTLILVPAVVSGQGQTKPKPAPAQNKPLLPPPTIPPDEAAAVTSGWLLLSQGKYREAADYGLSLLGKYPRSAAALSLAIESVIAGRGAYSSLDIYEQWLGNRTFEEPTVLARIARANLYEWSRQTTDETARVDALKALAADGVPEALSALASGAAAGGLAEDRALIALGDIRAVDRVVARMRDPTSGGLKVIEISMLGESRSPRALKPLLELLRDERRENRAGAADALGKLGQADAIGPLKAALSDPIGFVRDAASGALVRLGDMSGIGRIREMAASEHAAVRRSAAVLLSSVPDEEWKNLVRGLASDPDPSFRLTAAQLLAPHDEAFSKSLLEALYADTNPEIRDQAGVLLAQSTARVDIPVLRRLLRTGTGRVRIAAADRLLKAFR